MFLHFINKVKFVDEDVYLPKGNSSATFILTFNFTQEDTVNYSCFQVWQYSILIDFNFLTREITPFLL